MPDRQAVPSAKRRGAGRPHGDPRRAPQGFKADKTDTRPFQPHLLGRWWFVLGLITVIVVVCALLWHRPGLRPYLAGIGAGLAAFISPLPALLQPETPRKWQVAIGLACVVGLGTWFSTDAIQRERDLLEGKRDQLEQSFQSQRESVESWLKRLPTDQQNAFLLYGQGRLLSLYRRREFKPVVDFAQLLAAIDQGNGHALYFEGEAYRSLGRTTDMREALRRYLQVADHHPEAQSGDAYSCSQRPAGYCGERTEWVQHLLANDYLQQSRTGARSRATTCLASALSYERGVLRTRPHGFEQEGSMLSSCAMLKAIAVELAAAHQPATEAAALLKTYRARFGPC